VIVTRHDGVLEWLMDCGYVGRNIDKYTVIRGNATADDVDGKTVIGNVPLHLAAVAKAVMAVEFSEVPPRGQEYGAAEMKAAGAYLAKYTVQAHPEPW
jgi:putative CRISPR-associated protein (TIGR02620 family)